MPLPRQQADSPNDGQRRNPYHWARSCLFRLDPETAHHGAVMASAACEALLRLSPVQPSAYTAPALRQTICGLSFPNPVGLAAGFDKDARAPHLWPLLGFGFAELGTITRHPQDGNPRPRMFRLPADRAIINRLGFNNAGADVVAVRLAQRLRHGRPAIPLGINIGKSKITANADADADYAYSLAALYPYADYITVNVSSPNTPGLRALQGDSELAQLIATLRTQSRRLAEVHDCAPRPIFVKLAPDLDDDALARLVDVIMTHEASGLIATNTTLSRAALRQPCDEAGGLSGAPLRERANEVMRILRRRAGAALPLIGVGGIFTAADAYERIRCGADLVQIYSALIYEGPLLARTIARGLLPLLQGDGYTHVSQAVGRDV